MDVITTVAALSEYYGVEEELEQITDRHYRQLIEEYYRRLSNVTKDTG